MECWKLLLRRPEAGPRRVSRGTLLVSDSESSPEKARPENPRSVSPPPPSKPYLSRSAPNPSHTSFSPSLPKKCRRIFKGRSPIYTQHVNRSRFKAVGAKLAADSESSLGKPSPSNPRSIVHPPSRRPDLGRSVALRSPPPPQKPIMAKTRRLPSPPRSAWVNKRLRRLPRYFYRWLPDSFYLSAIPEAAQSKNPTLVADAELQTGGKAKLLYTMRLGSKMARRQTMKRMRCLGVGEAF